MRMTIFPAKEIDDKFFSDINVKNDGVYRCLNEDFEKSIWDEYFGLTKDGKLVKDTINAMMKDEVSIPERESLIDAFDWTGKLIIENESYKDDIIYLPEYMVSLIFVWELPIIHGYFDINKRKLIQSGYRFYK